MTQARSQIVVDGQVGIYHCMSRCVRQAFLCGFDPVSQRSYEHRREWIRERLKNLSGLFGVDVMAYAVMHNHWHGVVRTRPDRIEGLNDEQVVRRWMRVFPKKREGTASEQRAAIEMEVSATCANVGRVQELRRRLSNVSWFMKSVNEKIARRGNHEDGTKGRFWEGRFKCQALLDEAALLTCMTYVDLNPVRAALADSLEDSEFTSIYDRIVARQSREREAMLNAQRAANSVDEHWIATMERMLKPDADRWLYPLDGKEGLIPGLDTESYLRLVDATGRLIRCDKRGAIPADVLPILESLEINTQRWASDVAAYGSLFYRVTGRVGAFLDAAKRAGQRFMKGRGASEDLFGLDMAISSA